LAVIYEVRCLDHVSGTEAAVQVRAREVQVALCRGDDDAVGAGHAEGEILCDGAAAVAETELLAAHADDGAVVGARCAVAVGRGVVAGCLGCGRWCGCGRWNGLRGGCGRLSWLGCDDCRGSCGGR
jgi:hypothetical protein